VSAVRDAARPAETCYVVQWLSEMVES